MEDAKWVEISFIQGRKILWKKVREISFILWKMHRHSFIQARSIFCRFFSFLWEIHLSNKDSSFLIRRKIFLRLISHVWKNVAASFIIWKMKLHKIFLPFMKDISTHFASSIKLVYKRDFSSNFFYSVPSFMGYRWICWIKMYAYCQCSWWSRLVFYYFCVDPLFKWSLHKNTSLVGPGALAHHLQCRTACITSQPALSKMADRVRKKVKP